MFGEGIDYYYTTLININTLTLLLPVRHGLLESPDASQELSLDILAVNEAILKAFDLVLVLLGLDADILDILGRLPCDMHLGLFMLCEHLRAFISEIGTTGTLEGAGKFHYLHNDTKL